jgi:N-acetylmuramoyl-L-alanine amidase
VSHFPLPTRALLFALATFTAHAQTSPAAPTPPPRKPRPKTPQSPYNPNVVLLDPAHGGSDNGARLSGEALEKDADIALADRIKTLLTSRGFTVLLTHDSADDQPTADQRLELANRSHASACILLHAANGGHGVHIFSSSLAAPATASSPYADSSDSTAILPWDTAQAGTLSESQHLASTFADAFADVRIPLVSGRVSVPPIDSLVCPAIAIELAPLPAADNSSSTPASDPAYQQRVASAIASALSTWRGHIMAQIAGAAMIATPPPAAKPIPKPKPSPKPARIPVETPMEGPPQ